MINFAVLVRWLGLVSLVLYSWGCARDTSFTSAQSYPPLAFESDVVKERIDFQRVEGNFSIEDFDSWRQPRPRPSVLVDGLNLEDSAFSAPGLLSLVQQDTAGVWTLVLLEQDFDRGARLLNAVADNDAELLDPNLEAGYLLLRQNSEQLRLLVERRSDFWYVRVPDLEPEAAAAYLQALERSYQS